eukprot:jgi/Bigna1/84421/fgenesh1_pg.136_\
MAQESFRSGFLIPRYYTNGNNEKEDKHGKQTSTLLEFEGKTTPGKDGRLDDTDHPTKMPFRFRKADSAAEPMFLYRTAYTGTDPAVKPYIMNGAMKVLSGAYGPGNPKPVELVPQSMAGNYHEMYLKRVQEHHDRPSRTLSWAMGNTGSAEPTRAIIP